jgi:hypothetical protein
MHQKQIDREETANMVEFLAILYHKQVSLSQAVSDGTISNTVAVMLQSSYQRVSSLAECKMHPCTKSHDNTPGIYALKSMLFCLYHKRVGSCNK